MLKKIFFFKISQNMKDVQIRSNVAKSICLKYKNISSQLIIHIENLCFKSSTGNKVLSAGTIKRCLKKSTFTVLKFPLIFFI